MKPEFELKVNTKDGMILALLSIGLFVILFVGSLFEHKYSIPMRYVSYGMPILLLFVSLGLYQMGNFTITITQNKFVFKSLLKNRNITFSSIKKVELKSRNSVIDLIFKISVRNAIDFRFNRYNVEDSDIKEIMSIIEKYID